MKPLAQLAAEVGVNERTLRRAVNEGALRASRPSARKLELALGERWYVSHRWSLIADLRKVLRTEHDVRFAMLFGSAARGDDTERSDVDVVADLRDPDFLGEIDLSVKLEEAVGRPVDVVDLKRIEEDPTFLAMALADGRVLVDREGIWSALKQREPDLRRRGRRRDRRRRRDAFARADRFLEEKQWPRTS